MTKFRHLIWMLVATSGLILSASQSNAQGRQPDVGDQPVALVRFRQWADRPAHEVHAPSLATSQTGGGPCGHAIDRRRAVTA